MTLQPGSSDAEPGTTVALEVTVPELLRALGARSVQIIDVREPDEWAEGRIPGSLHLPMAEIADRLHEIDPVRPVVAVCRVGVRSLYVAEALHAAGYTQVRSLAGGLNAWVDAGQALEV